MQTNREDAEGQEHQMVVRLPKPLFKRVQEIAKSEQRTVSAEVRWLMERRVEEKEAA